MLRLAQALDGDRTTGMLRVKALTYPKRVVLQLQPSRGGAELELWSLKKEAAYFREVLRRELLVDVA